MNFGTFRRLVTSLCEGYRVDVRYNLDDATYDAWVYYDETTDVTFHVPTTEEEGTVRIKCHIAMVEIHRLAAEDRAAAEREQRAMMMVRQTEAMGELKELLETSEPQPQESPESRWELLEKNII